MKILFILIENLSEYNSCAKFHSFCKFCSILLHSFKLVDAKWGEGGRGGGGRELVKKGHLKLIYRGVFFPADKNMISEEIILKLFAVIITHT